MVPVTLTRVELTSRIAELQLAETFTISRESQDEAEVVHVEVRHGDDVGFGEAAPIERYDESAASALAYLEEVGDAIGADGVVLHPGSTVGEPHEEALDRVGDALRTALEESDGCPLLLEDTAGAGGTLGRVTGSGDVRRTPGRLSEGARRAGRMERMDLLALEQQARRPLVDQARRAFGRGMGAVGGTEGVIDVHIRE